MAYDKALLAMADPTRRAILEKLRRRPQSVGQIAAGLDVSRPAVSQHLKHLGAAGLVQSHAEGTRRIYAVDARGLNALREYLERFWGDALEAFRLEAESAPGPRAAAAHRRSRRTQPANRRRHD